jgi:hypothetical protein
MRIDPALAERLEAVLRRRAESWAAEHQAAGGFWR